MLMVMWMAANEYWCEACQCWHSAWYYCNRSRNDGPMRPRSNTMSVMWMCNPCDIFHWFLWYWLACIIILFVIHSIQVVRHKSEFEPETTALVAVGAWMVVPWLVVLIITEKIRKVKWWQTKRTVARIVVETWACIRKTSWKHASETITKTGNKRNGNNR